MSKKNRPRQSSVAARQAGIGGQDTSQTTGGGRFANTDATSSTKALGASNEFPISGRPRASGSDRWTISGAIAGWAAVIVTVLAGFGGLVWYVSKADTLLTTVQADVGEVKKKMEGLSGQTNQHSGHLQRIDGAITTLQAALRDLIPGNRVEQERSRK